MIKSRVVFVGNIPYDKTETQLADIFSEAGNVLSFRLVFDRDSGKPKGYGFCTFQDYETAASAVRNLNNYDVGGRQLRVDFAESDKEAVADNDRSALPRQQFRPDIPQPTQPVATPSGGIDSITQTVQSTDPQQIAEVLSYLKLMTQTNPEQVTTLLAQNPQLSFAILQALISMNLIDQFTMQRILAAQTVVAPFQPTPVPAPVFAPMMPPTDIAAQLQEQQKQLVLQLINLTPEQIQALPLDQQQQVIQLRAQIMGNQ